MRETRRAVPRTGKLPEMQPKREAVDRRRWATCSTATHPIARGTRCSRAPTSPARTTQSLHDGARHAVARRLRGALRRARPRVPRPGHHVLALGRGAARSRSTSCPRIIAADEWAVDRGRACASGCSRSSAFLADVYGPGEILADGVVPAPPGRHARRTSTAACTGIDPPGGVRVHVAGHRPRPRRRRAASACSRTTCARRRASRTSSRTAGR